MQSYFGLLTAKEQLKMYHQAVAEKAQCRVEQKVEEKREYNWSYSSWAVDYERSYEALGTKVRVTKRGEKGNIKIDYFSLEELKRLVKIIASK